MRGPLETKQRKQIIFVYESIEKMLAKYYFHNKFLKTILEGTSHNFAHLENKNQPTKILFYNDLFTKKLGFH